MYAQQQMDVKPRFEAEEVDEKYKRRVFHKENGENIECKVEVVDGTSWIIEFPQGHSIRVTSEAEMIRLGFLDRPSLLDMNTGEYLTPEQPKSLKELNASRVKQTKGSRAAARNDVDEVNEVLGIN